MGTSINPSAFRNLFAGFLRYFFLASSGTQVAASSLLHVPLTCAPGLLHSVVQRRFVFVSSHGSFCNEAAARVLARFWARRARNWAHAIHAAATEWTESTVKVTPMGKAEAEEEQASDHRFGVLDRNGHVWPKITRMTVPASQCQCRSIIAPCAMCGPRKTQHLHYSTRRATCRIHSKRVKSYNGSGTVARTRHSYSTLMELVLTLG